MAELKSSTAMAFALAAFEELMSLAVPARTHCDNHTNGLAFVWQHEIECVQNVVLACPENWTG